MDAMLHFILAYPSEKVTGNREGYRYLFAQEESNVGHSQCD